MTLAGCSGGTGTPDAGMGDDDAGLPAVDAGGDDDDAGSDDPDSGSDMDGGRDAGAMSDGGSDAGADAGPPPLLEDVDDGTVALPHNFPSCAPAFGVDAASNIFIVHTTVEDGIRVKRLVGGMWTAVGDRVNDVAHALNINVCTPMVVTSAGVPYVAYLSSSATGTQLRVRRFDGAAWVDAFALDAGLGMFAPGLGIDLAVDAMDRVVVAAMEFEGTNYGFRVRREESGTFVPFGPRIAVNPAGIAVTTRPDGTVVLAAMVNEGFSKFLEVYTSTGGDWVQHGPDVAIAGGGTTLIHTDVDADDTTIWVSYQQSVASTVAAHLARSNATGWDILTPMRDDSRNGSVALTGGGELVQGYSHSTDRCDVRRHDGTVFEGAVELPGSVMFVRLQQHDGVVFVGYRIGAEARLARLNLP